MRCWPNAGARVPRLPEYGLVRAVRRLAERARPAGPDAAAPHQGRGQGRQAQEGPTATQEGPAGALADGEARRRSAAPAQARAARAARTDLRGLGGARQRCAPGQARLLSPTAFAMVFLTFEFVLAHHSSAQIRQQHQRCSLHGRSAWVALHRHNGHLLRSCTCSLSRCCGLHHQAGQRRTPGLLQPGVVWRERERIDQHPYAACSMHGPALRCVAVEHLPKSVAARVLRTRVLAARHHRRNHRGSLGTGCSLWLGLRRWRTLLARQGRKRLFASSRSGACSRRLGALRNGGR